MLLILLPVLLLLSLTVKLGSWGWVPSPNITHTVKAVQLSKRRTLEEGGLLTRPFTSMAVPVARTWAFTLTMKYLSE